MKTFLAILMLSLLTPVPLDKKLTNENLEGGWSVKWNSTDLTYNFNKNGTYSWWSNGGMYIYYGSYTIVDDNKLILQEAGDTIYHFNYEYDYKNRKITAIGSYLGSSGRKIEIVLTRLEQ